MASVTSVVRSGVADVTVVVSDNSTNSEEKERLRDFCAGQPAELVQYVEPPESLAMPAHWEWLWHRIEETISPSHVSYLTDRLVFTAGSLAELAGVVADDPDRVVSYHWDHVNDLATPVELVQTPWTGQLFELDCRRLAELSSRGSAGNYLPRLMTCVAPTGVVSTIERRFGNVFGSVAPDYRFAYRCLAVCDSILYLDRACVIEQGMARSAGGNYVRGNVNEDAADFIRQLSVPRFDATPEPGFETTANAIFQEYCSVREEAGGDGFPPPDRRGYLTANAIAADRIQDPEWRARTQELLSARGWTRWDGARHAAGLTLRMAAYLIRHPAALARAIRRQLWDRPPGTAAGTLLARLGIDPPTRDDLTFASAAEAIAHADAHPRRPTPQAWHVHELARARAIVSVRRTLD